MRSVQDERGYNQGWIERHSTIVRLERRAEYIVSQMDRPLRGSVLEIGCGTGRNAYFLAQKTGLSVLGTDLSRSFIDEAQRRYQLPNLRYALLDFNRAESFDADRFTYIVGNGILHHLYYRLPAALQSIRRLLLEPNLHNPYVFAIFRMSLLRRWARLEPGEMAFSRRFAIRALREAGFRNIMVEYRDFLLPGVPDVLIAPSIGAGRVLERVPGIRMMSQSIYISARG
jgi:SAM-dependent methyltransferase